MTEEDKKYFESKGFNFKSGFGEEYNTFVCDEAIIIAKELKTKDDIIKFHKLHPDEQKKMVPLLDMKAHSGNTLDMSCRFALAYLPKLIVDNRDDKFNMI